MAPIGASLPVSTAASSSSSAVGGAGGGSCEPGGGWATGIEDDVGVGGGGVGGGGVGGSGGVGGGGVGGGGVGSIGDGEGIAGQSQPVLGSHAGPCPTQLFGVNHVAHLH